MPLSADVTVVIPVYNGERFVGEAIESVLAQRGFAPEVIVVDNNSTDGTRQMVRDRYGARVTLIEEPRPGAAFARNTGARAATGTWLAFLDADDIWLPEKLERQAAAWAAAPDAGMVFTLAREFHSPDLDADEIRRFVCRPDPYQLLTPSSLLLRREVFERVGELPALPGGEFIAWFGWARELGLRELVVPEVLVRRRVHSRNTTRGAGTMAGYPMAAKWLMDRRREAKARRGSAA
jgi:glycosyltransferase involved in cell wall biosynthesis